LGVTDLAFASSAPPKTQVKSALDGLLFVIEDVLWNYFL
jgi:hypothetical protein